MNEIMNRLFALVPDGDPWDAGQSQVFSNVEEYIGELEEKATFLDCLQSCGVDNWCGYEEAQEMMEEANE